MHDPTYPPPLAKSICARSVQHDWFVMGISINGDNCDVTGDSFPRQLCRTSSSRRKLTMFAFKDALYFVARIHEAGSPTCSSGPGLVLNSTGVGTDWLWRVSL